MTTRKPRIGIFGIMQELYDDMVPGITERQAGYANELAEQLSDVAECIAGRPVKNRADAESVMREFEGSDLDGLLVVMLTYGPAMRVARLLSECRLPICLANIQPEPNVTAAAFTTRASNRFVSPGTAFCSSNTSGTSAAIAARATGTLAKPPNPTTAAARR